MCQTSLFAALAIVQLLKYNAVKHDRKNVCTNIRHNIRQDSFANLFSLDTACSSEKKGTS